MAAPGNVTQAVLTDKSAKVPGMVTLQITGRHGAYAVGPNVVAGITLPATGACFDARFPATPPARPSCTLAKHTLTCR
jgi:hypothetical protein